MSKQKDLIPLREISELTPYSTDKLFGLADSGALKSVEREGERYTTIAWVNEFFAGGSEARLSGGQARLSGGQEEKSELLSLTEAARFSSYSAEYLALRIRQGKLRGEKVGRNWHTQREWVDAYAAANGAVESTSVAAPTVIASENVRHPELVSGPVPESEKQMLKQVQHDGRFGRFGSDGIAAPAAHRGGSQ